MDPVILLSFDCKHLDYWVCLDYLDYLLSNLIEVEEYNLENPFDPITDPSDQCFGIVLLLIKWYRLFRRRYPPKDEVDIQDLEDLSMGQFF